MLKTVIVFLALAISSCVTSKHSSFESKNETFPNRVTQSEPQQTKPKKTKKKTDAYYAKTSARLYKAAENSLLTNDSKIISRAHFNLFKFQSIARKDGRTCDVAYLFDTINSLRTAVENNPNLMKNLQTNKYFNAVAPESLSARLIAEGFIKGKTLSKSEFVNLVSKIINKSSFQLYGPQPGVMPGTVSTINKGTISYSGVTFNETSGEIETYTTEKRPISIRLNAGRIEIYNGTRLDSIVRVKNSNEEIVDDNFTTDMNFEILGIDEQGQVSENYMNQTFIFPDECSA